MKYLLLVPALTVFASSAIAVNKITVDAGVEAYVATGLTASQDPLKVLKFPDIVAPASGSYTVEVSPSTGDVTYTGASAPGLGGVNADSNLNQNTDGSALVGQRVHQVGELDVQGEPGYAFSMSIVMKDGVLPPTGMSYTSSIDNGTGDVTGTASLALDANGDATVKYGGELEVTDDFAITGLVTSLQLSATIAYR